MKKEIVQRQIEAKTLREDLEATQRQTVADKKEYEKLTDELEKLKVCCFILRQVIFTSFKKWYALLCLCLFLSSIFFYHAGKNVVS